MKIGVQILVGVLIIVVSSFIYDRVNEMYMQRGLSEDEKLP